MTETYSRQALILSNNAQLEKETRKVLTTLQYSTDSALSSVEALELTKQGDYLFFIVDESFTGSIYSTDFYKTLIENQPEYKHRVIFFSDDSSKTFTKQVKEFGCEHLIKPFKTEDLLVTLDVLKTKRILIEDRVEMHYNWNGECIVDGFKGETIDISSTEIKVIYNGEVLEDCPEVQVQIPSIGYDGKAQVRWTVKAGGQTVAELDLIDFLSRKELKKAIPFAT